MIPLLVLSQRRKSSTAKLQKIELEPVLQQLESVRAEVVVVAIDQSGNDEVSIDVTQHGGERASWLEIARVANGLNVRARKDHCARAEYLTAGEERMSQNQSAIHPSSTPSV